MGVLTDIELRPIADPGDPDDWRPDSRWALACDPEAALAVVVESIAPGDRIPLHVHRIDEVLLFESGEAEVRLGDERTRVGAGAVVFVPAGTPHGTTNSGPSPVHVRAVFPTHVIDIEYLERNPAPGTEDAAPRPPVAYDARTGAMSQL